MPVFSLCLLKPVQTLVVSTSAPATWLLPLEIARFFFFLLPQNQTDGNASAVTVAATTCLCKATARCFTLGPFF